MAKYFWTKASGVKADVDRHRAQENELLQKIADLEGKDDRMSIAALRAYRNILNILQQSKADVVSKIGRKK